MNEHLIPPPASTPPPPPPPPSGRRPAGLTVDQQLRAAAVTPIRIQVTEPGDEIAAGRAAVVAAEIVQKYIRDGVVVPATPLAEAPYGAGICLKCQQWDAKPLTHPSCPDCGKPWSATVHSPDSMWAPSGASRGSDSDVVVTFTGDRQPPVTLHGFAARYAAIDLGRVVADAIAAHTGAAVVAEIGSADQPYDKSQPYWAYRTQGPVS